MSTEIITPEVGTAISATPIHQQTVPIAGAPPKSALMGVGETGIRLNTVEEIFLFAKAVLNSGLAPRDFKTPEAVLVAIQMGMELGLPPMAALQGIAVINGRPSVFGDAMPGIVNASGLMDDYKDELIGADESLGYRVTVKRKGRADPLVRTFTVAMAKKAAALNGAGSLSHADMASQSGTGRPFAFTDYRGSPMSARFPPTFTFCINAIIADA